MKRFTLILTVAAVGTLLAACGEKAAAPTTTEQAAPAAAPEAGPMMARGTGTVTAVDKAGGAVTINHGPIAEAGWPAMEMEFKATPASLLDTVKVGDKVSFQLKMADGTGEVTAITAQ